MPRMDITALRDEVEDLPEDTVMAWMVDIPVGPKQTYRYEFLVNGTARIYKSVSQTHHSYEVKDGICSCPAAYHSKACKHVKPIVGFLASRVDTSAPDA